MNSFSFLWRRIRRSYRKTAVLARVDFVDFFAIEFEFSISPTASISLYSSRVERIKNYRYHETLDLVVRSDIVTSCPLAN